MQTGKELFENYIIESGMNDDVKDTAWKEAGMIDFAELILEQKKVKPVEEKQSELNLIIDSFEKLESDWNGADALKFNKNLLEKSKKIVALLLSTPEIYPTGNNSIQFQYELANGGYLELEIFNDKVKTWFITN